jgi:hypothetical protein
MTKNHAPDTETRLAGTKDLNTESATNNIPLPPWAAELPIFLDAWPDFKAKHRGLPGVRLTWPAGSPGLVAECLREGVQ